MQLDGFKIQRKAFTDAIGETFVATAKAGTESVYLKILHKDFCADEVLIRTFQDCLTHVALDSYPSCPRMLSSGIQDGRPFAVFEYFDLKPLSNFLSGQSFLTVDKSLHLIELLAHAVQTLHKNGRVHKHLNPQTIFVNAELDAIKLANPGFADFIIQLIYRKHQRLLEPLPYISPHFIQTGESSPEDDLFAIGVLFYEFLVGQSPQSQQSLHQLLAGNGNGAIVPPSLKRLEIPDALDRIVFLALEANRGTTTDVSDFIAELIQVKPAIKTASYDAKLGFASIDPEIEQMDAAETRPQLFDEIEENTPAPDLSDRDLLVSEGKTHSDTSITPPDKESMAPRRTPASQSIDEMDPFSHEDETGTQSAKHPDAVSAVEQPPNLQKEQQEGRFTEIDWLLTKELAHREEQAASAPVVVKETKDVPQETEKTEAAERSKLDPANQVKPTPLVNDTSLQNSDAQTPDLPQPKTLTPCPFPALQNNEFDDRTTNPVIRRGLFKPNSPGIGPQVHPTPGIPNPPHQKSGGKRSNNPFMVTMTPPAGALDEIPLPAGSYDDAEYDEVETEQLAQTDTLPTTQTIDLTQPFLSGSSIWMGAKILLLTLIPLITIYFLIIITFDLEFKQRIVDLKDWVMGEENQVEVRTADGAPAGRNSGNEQRPLLPSEIKQENAIQDPLNKPVEQKAPPGEKQTPQEITPPVSEVAATPERRAPAAAENSIKQPSRTKLQRRPETTRRALPKELVVHVVVHGDNLPRVAKIYIDGKLYGLTNEKGSIAVHGLDFGHPYLIKVERKGFEMWATETKFAKTTPNTIDVTLRPKPLADK